MSWRVQLIVSAETASLPSLYAAQAGRGRESPRHEQRKALKWFPDRRGLAAGLWSWPLGRSGATVRPWPLIILHHGYEQASWFGSGGPGIVAPLIALSKTWRSAHLPNPVCNGRDFTPGEMLRNSVSGSSILDVDATRSPDDLYRSDGQRFRVAEMPVTCDVGRFASAMELDRVMGGLTDPFSVGF